MVPLNDETRAKLNAAYHAHAVAVDEAGLERNQRNTSPMEHDIYTSAFKREMTKSGYTETR